MRVTAGKLKGRKLIDNTFEHIRPTADVVKQSIFNKLTFEVVDADVLDLFGGTGALGIEAYSRGAKKVIIVDKDYRSVKMIKENITNLKIDEKCIRVYKASYEDAIKRLENEKFDIIIIDPPYKSGYYENAIKLIYQFGILAEGGIIVCEHDKKDEFDFSPFVVIDEKIYGIKKVTYLSRNQFNISINK